MPWFSFLRRHNTWTAQIDAYVDGELDRADAARFEAHLAACDRCREEEALARSAKRSLAALPVEPAPRSFHISPSMLAEAPNPSAAPVRQQSWYPRAAAGMMAAAVAAFAILVTVDVTGDSASNDGSVAASNLSEDARTTGAETFAAGENDAQAGPEAASGLAEEDGAGSAELAPNDAGGGEAIAPMSPEGDDDSSFDTLRAAQVASAVVAAGAFGAFIVTRRQSGA